MLISNAFQIFEYIYFKIFQLWKTSEIYNFTFKTRELRSKALSLIKHRGMIPLVTVKRLQQLTVQGRTFIIVKPKNIEISTLKIRTVVKSSDTKINKSERNVSQLYVSIDYFKYAT